MDRDKAELRSGHDIAFKAFNAGIQNCQSDDELAGFVRMICTLSAKVIHGMDGKQFKKDFLRGAISDNEKITPVRPN